MSVYNVLNITFYREHKKESTIIFEVVADKETCIWHDLFGMPSFAMTSMLFDACLFYPSLPIYGASPPVTFEANGRTYNMCYHLVDDIYLKCSTSVKPVQGPLR
jgi:hypothetical protein